MKALPSVALLFVTVLAPSMSNAEPERDTTAADLEVSFKVTVPALRDLSFPNGARVVLVERHDLPIVAVRVTSTIGASG